MTKIKKYACPTCHKQIEYKLDNAYRPFCSDRCKLIDLGEWADESRKIPGEVINPENLNSPENEED